MIRRESLTRILAGLGASSITSGSIASANQKRSPRIKELKSDLVIVGGGLGGCAAALSALKSGIKVIMTEETDWIGGQLTSQGVPPDEHKWIESLGSTKSYRALRNSIRKYYKNNYPLNAKAKSKKHLNPGNGSVSRLCHEPIVALRCLESLLLPYIIKKQLILLKNTIPISANLNGDNINSVKTLNTESGHPLIIHGKIFADASELGDLLPITNCEHVMGTEGRKETGELHMPEKHSPMNQQAFTTCFAVDYDPDKEHLIEKPKNYKFWRSYIPKLDPPWPGRLLDFHYTHPASGEKRLLGFNPHGPHGSGIINLWTYRRILAKENFQEGSNNNDISLINWPQNDYLLGNLTGVSIEERSSHIKKSKELSLSLLYWLQTEVPRDDGKEGWPGLRLRKDVFGTKDGLAKYPYVRESLRIKALETIKEQDCGLENRTLILAKKQKSIQAKRYADSIGIGHYQIDLHPSSGGNNYIDFPALPFEIPLGSLIPERLTNLIAAAKNIGTTHVTNGCYRLHPVEWNVGEVAGYLAATSIKKKSTPRAIRNKKSSLNSFQRKIQKEGIEIHWPEEILN